MKCFIKIKKIPPERFDHVLVTAGYVWHNGCSWIKRIIDKRRFHIYPGGKELEIHMDKTVHGYHVVAGMDTVRVIKEEAARIKRVNKILYPPPLTKSPSKKKIKKKSSTAYAPNLIEIQRNFKGKIYSE